MSTTNTTTPHHSLGHENAGYLANRIPCPNNSCNAALLPGAKSCRFCGAVLQKPAPVKPQPNPSTAALARPAFYEVVVYGRPIAEGSTKIGKSGKIVHDNGAALEGWRQAIEDALRQKYWDPEWEPLDGPVRGDIVFTMPRPGSAPKGRPIYPATKPDVDKLLRGATDALSPKAPSKTGKGLHPVRTGPHRGHPHFRLLNEDSRVVEWGTGPIKTHPRPFHTHPGALDEPGVRLRIEPLVQPQTLRPG